MSMQAKGLLITMMGALLVVPDSLFVRLIDADPLVIAFWRAVTSGTAVLVGVLVWMGPRAVSASLRTGWHGALYIVVLAASGVLFVMAVSLTSVANVVIIIATMPVFAAIFSRIFLGEPISRRMVLTMLFVIVGLAIVAYGTGENATASRSGDALALLLTVSFAAALTAVRRVRDVSMVPAVPVAFLASAVILWPMVEPMSIAQDQVWLVLLHGAFITGSSIGLALGPRYITSAEVALLILLETVLAPLLAWAVVGEDPGRWALAGGAIVVGALGVSNAVALLRRR
ncbi:DMT family transporter [Shimia sp. FJ5]|uniref:DMT family transporter n=1 Tax=Shimia sp. FJ5 TaxID=3079054 RepID=UPI002603ECE0|nr:DMT family transporter [Shimia sp. FJ5]MDV4143349.1 DMT family transporter [Shimia sp. FJ5]